MYFRNCIVLLLCVFSCLMTGCGGGSTSDNADPRPVSGSLILSGTAVMPLAQSATATANLRSGLNYIGLKAYLVDRNGKSIVDPVALDSEGVFVFNNVVAGDNYHLLICSPKGKVLLRRCLDSVKNTLTNIVVGSYSSAVATIVLKSNYSLSAAKVEAADIDNTISLNLISQTIEKWLSGTVDSHETDVSEVVEHRLGDGTINSMIATITGDGGAAPLTSDLIFYPDSGKRTVKGTGMPMAKINENGTVYLYYGEDATNGSPGNKLAIAADGLTFGNISSPPSTYLYHPKFVLMPDGVTRRTYAPGGNMSPNVVSMSFTGNEQPTADAGVRYTAGANDGGTIGIVEVFADDKGGYVMLYIGDLQNRNDVRRAYSQPGDNGMNFTYTNDNVLGDAGLTKGSDKNVDQFSLLLPDGRRRLFTMAEGGRRINSFITSDYGTTFTREPGVRLAATDYVEFKVYSLHDPSVVRLPDGRYRMYVCGRIDNNVNVPDNDPQRYTEVILSATTRQSQQQ